MLKLVDVLAIESPERERIVEIDDAIRDLMLAVEAEAESDGSNRLNVSGMLVAVLLAAAAQQAVKAYPAMSRADLDEAFAALAEEAINWASRRAEPGRREQGGGDASRPLSRRRRGPA
ncbi:hypothetical protein [Roseiarcus sp.]|uniref:hypothetical protein n=1 Tax=Roseiarcus sp. TaxID=1969460 RepID=UPI003F9B44DD